jgi:uncharacterized membrane protein YgcG
LLLLPIAIAFLAIEQVYLSMKKIATLILFFAFTSCLNAQSDLFLKVKKAIKENYPEVNLEHKLISVEKYSSNQIAIVSVNSLDGYSIEDYANKLFRDWGIGTKEKNNGILLLFSLTDRKIRIEVGYGLEEAVSNKTAKSIIDNDITPNFKNKEYYAGINKAIDDLVLAANGIYEIPNK